MMKLSLKIYFQQKIAEEKNQKFGSVIYRAHNLD